MHIPVEKKELFATEAMITKFWGKVLELVPVSAATDTATVSHTPTKVKRSSSKCCQERV